MGEIEKKIKLNKKPKKNKKNDDQIEKKYMINWDWMMKLKAKKKIYKSIKNKRIRTEIELTITKRIRL